MTNTPIKASLDRLIARSVGQGPKTLTTVLSAPEGVPETNVEYRKGATRRQAQAHGGEGGCEAAVLPGPTSLKGAPVPCPQRPRPRRSRRY